jgi:ribosomal protein S12 methylthiotransferase
MPEVDDYFGVNELRKIIERVGGEYKESLLGERRLTTPPHYAYLKIAEGCDRKCSFCSIPMIRGRHISRPVEEIIKEARFLVQKGVREVNLISQDTTFYGLDLYHRRKLPELMQKLADIPGLDWIRLHYTYPDHFPLKVLDLIRERPNICKYIDIPLQHINTRILRSMKRGIDREGTIRIVNMIRDKIPGVAIRSTMIVGYPGETQKEFEELKEFIEGSQFDRLGVFAYSKEEDTGAAEMADNVSPKIKRQRVNELMELQQDISLHLNKRKVNGDLKVIIDRQEGIYYIGRSEADSPEIDNEVLIPVHGNELVIGNFYNVRIKSAESFDLYGEIVP